jgi:hypothetical protein
MSDKVSPVEGKSPVVGLGELGKPTGPAQAGDSAAGPPAVQGAPQAPGPAGPSGGESAFPPTVRRRVALTLEDTKPLWDAFRAGAVVPCPSDGGSLALNVDGLNAYRLVCTQCGTASSWFEALPTGLRDRTTPAPAEEDPTDD